VPVLAPLALAVLEVALLTLDIRSCVVVSTGFAQTEPEWGVMKWDWITASWKQFPGQVKEKWGKFADDHLTTIAAKEHQLVGKPARGGKPRTMSLRDVFDNKLGRACTAEPGCGRGQPKCP
jgi:uncharacterized protein YjbJ (UPF0337 family)